MLGFQLSFVAWYVEEQKGRHSGRGVLSASFCFSLLLDLSLDDPLGTVTGTREKDLTIGESARGPPYFSFLFKGVGSAFFFPPITPAERVELQITGIRSTRQPVP